MRYVHGTDDPKRDRLRRWCWYAVGVLFLGITAGYFVLMLTEDGAPLLFFSLIFMPLFGGCVFQADWMNGKYEIRREGIYTQSLLNKKTVRWEDIFAYGAFDVFVMANNKSKYIVFFLTREIPDFWKSLDWYFVRQNKFLIIRATEERIGEFKAAIPKEYHISWIRDTIKGPT